MIDNTAVMQYMSDCCRKASARGDVRLRFKLDSLRTMDWMSIGKRVRTRLEILGYAVSDETGAIIVDWSQSAKKGKRGRDDR